MVISSKFCLCGYLFTFICEIHRPHYNLNLEGIAVNGQTLAIDSSVFATSSTQGTIVDSGTTLAYLADQAYDPFVNAVSFYHVLTFIKIVEFGFTVSFLNFETFPSTDNLVCSSIGKCIC